MLDARKIGAYISKLRKEKDMTQMELANELNVSHQAVSKWERGESIPDIGTIPLIARLFHKSIDDILYAGETSNKPMGIVVNALSKNETKQVAELVNKREFPMEDLKDLAPIIKTSTLNNVAKQVEKELISPDLIVELAPFLDSEVLDEIVIETADEGIDWKFVSRLAPFISQETLSTLANKIKDSANIKDIVYLAPFLEREYLDKLVKESDTEEMNWDLVTHVAPFLSKDTVEYLANQLIESESNIDVKHLVQLAPFLGRNYIEKLITQLSHTDIVRHPLM